MKKKMNYGYLVDIFPVINTDQMVEIFIPKIFPWEESDKKAVINLVDSLEIRCNLKTRLLIKKDEGISEINLPFKKKGQLYQCELLKLFEENNILYERGEGEFCDGTKWSQKEATSEVIYNEDGMLEYIISPYWGEQYVMHFANKKSCPMAEGRRIEIIRYSNCAEYSQSGIERWFKYMLKKNRSIDFYTLNKIKREVRSGMGSIYYQKDDKTYEWLEY